MSIAAPICPRAGTLLPVLLPVLLAGVATGVLTMVLIFAPTKIFIAGGLAFGCLAGFLGLIAIGQAERWMLLLLAFGLPLAVSFTLFLHVNTVGHYVENVGGAAGVTITLSFLAALTVLGLWLLAGRSLRMPVLVMLPWLAYAAAGVLSLLKAPDPALVWFEILRLSMLLLLMVTVANITPDRLWFFLQALAVTMIFQALISIAQGVGGTGLGLGFLGDQGVAIESVDFEAKVRSTGTLGNPNMLAYFYELMLPLLFGAWLMARGVGNHMLFGLAVTLGLAGLALSLSRGGWLAMGLLLPIEAWLLARHRFLTPRGLAVIGTGLFLTLVMVGLFGGQAMERMFGDDGGSLSHRSTMNHAAWQVFMNSPFIGQGLNNFAPAFSRLDKTGATGLFGPVNHVVHNMYLFAAVEVGIIGFSGFLGIFGIGIYLGIRGFLNYRSPLSRSISLGVAFGLVAHLLHGTIDPGFRLSLPVSQVIAVLLGLLQTALINEEFFLSEPRAIPDVEKSRRPPRLLAAGRQPLL
ncbi:hypothetical protein CG51_00560 [Haematobacter missouriensis]|uniref:O-antigen ligase-related domain-containing protein n=1 Tax=Haematobacter missouriensis TaxID=366616 RepID=A0A212AIG5_9RHOB|nr:O-antigen ligase family protein [Haematobacter missouriensis]KFI32742.1 hypothetical protein CG51_00560 [Haematobacter missouriensis]OWJ79148.1 hypothetical protein CDV53_02375 [Haematobacter missouriensis]OWJ81292.1 hypothetical protein CDV52_18695 [Haematobacter missouriensis]